MSLPPMTVTSARGRIAPRLSILVPTYDRDILPLARELMAGMAALPEPGAVELLVLIDGNPALSGQEALLDEAEALGLAAGLYPSPRNLGRAEARNTLARLARGEVILFLDADGLPDSPDFVARALAEARSTQEVVCGGRSGRRLPPPPADALLFHTHSQKREWLPAAVRAQDPPANFLSANFQVGRALFLATPFDENFRGWGWEDTEWALRVLERVPLRHVDNSVTHMEYHRDADWLARLDRSLENYKRLHALHPAAVERHRIFPLIRLLRPLSGWAWPKALLLRLALCPRIPPGLRLHLAKLRQALVYGPLLD